MLGKDIRLRWSQNIFLKFVSYKHLVPPGPLRIRRSRVKVRNIAKLFVVVCLLTAGLVLSGCSSGTSQANENMVAATVNGRNIMLSEVERGVSQQTGGNPSSLNQLQMAQARLQVLNNLIQREVLFQRAEREKLLPTEAQIDGAIATQKQNSGMTAEDFDKRLKAQNMSMETLREEAKKDLAISAL